jgi:predicted kinase
MKVIIVCGSTGAGKTTYALKLAQELGAVRFSIDPWMQNLFAKDMQTLEYEWMIERVERCYKQIWEVSEQILSLGGTVVLDLGFTTQAQRAVFVEKSAKAGAPSEIHFLDVSAEVRRQRVKQRNDEQDPAVYAFEVTDYMFDFMEERFEAPDEDELENGKVVTDQVVADQVSGDGC